MGPYQLTWSGPGSTQLDLSQDRLISTCGWANSTRPLPWLTWLCLDVGPGWVDLGLDWVDPAQPDSTRPRSGSTWLEVGLGQLNSKCAQAYSAWYGPGPTRLFMGLNWLGSVWTQSESVQPSLGMTWLNISSGRLGSTLTLVDSAIPRLGLIQRSIQLDLNPDWLGSTWVWVN